MAPVGVEFLCLLLCGILATLPGVAAAWYASRPCKRSKQTARVKLRVGDGDSANADVARRRHTALLIGSARATLARVRFPGLHPGDLANTATGPRGPHDARMPRVR